MARRAQGSRRDRPAPAPAAYANQLEVGYNAFEFLLDFGQDYDGLDSTAATHTRIVTAPAYAKTFCLLLARTVTEYEMKFGPIPVPLEEVEEEG